MQILQCSSVMWAQFPYKRNSKMCCVLVKSIEKLNSGPSIIEISMRGENGGENKAEVCIFLPLLLLLFAISRASSENARKKKLISDNITVVIAVNCGLIARSVKELQIRTT